MPWLGPQDQIDQLAMPMLGLKNQALHIGAKMGHLLENSVMIPQGQRRDSNFHISYIM